RAFPSLSSAEFIIYRGLDVNSLPYSDVTICTLWTSAYLLARFSNTRGKFYFVQDYEPLFYPAGTFYALAEATYEMNFHCIVNTPGLYEFLVQKHGIYGEYFTPAVDTDLFYPVESLENKGNDRLKLFVYGRPHHDRNAFELAVATIHKLKQRLGDRIEIISAGSEWEPADYGLEGMVNNMGLIPMDRTADIYRQCDLGLVFMFTKHPSYLPLELMASGCVVVTNENSANRWLFDGKNALLVKPFPSYIVDKITGIINKKEEMQRIAQNALSTIKRLSWKGQMEKIWNFILKGRDNDILCDS
ncbi:MAG: glycosyltransferase, partial [Nitrospirae bacterium]